MVFFNAYILKLLLFLTIYVQDVKPKKEASNSNGFFISIQGKNNSTLELEFKKAVAFYENRKYVEGLRLALTLYEKIKKDDNTNIRYGLTNLIAKIYRNNKEHKKAILYFKKSLRLLNKNFNYNKELNIENDKYLAEIIFVLGSEYQQLKINDSAIFYYEKLAKLNSLDDEILARIGSSYTNLSAIYQNDTLQSNHHKIAIEFAEKAIAIHKKRNSKLSQASAISNLGSVYLRQRDFERSKKTYLNGIKLIKRDTSSIAIRIKSTLYYNLAWSMRNLKEYEAYDYQEISYDMVDALRNDELKENIKRITGEYNVDVVRKAGEFEKQKAQNLTWIIGSSSFSIILLLAFLLNQYKLRQKDLSLQLTKQKLFQQQKLEKIRTDSQIRILNATLNGKEAERKQIAETLHDNVSALLSSANLHLQACKKLFKGPIPVEVDKSQDIIHEASQKIRDLSHTLVSSILLKFGLAYAIKDMAEKYSNSQLEILCETQNIQRYDQDFEIKLHNIIQELINNTLKHSEATTASILLVENDEKLLLSIKDNGKGFDKLQVPKKDGLGINQIDARIHIMKGKFDIKSENNKGTLVTIELPVFKKELAKFL